MDNVSRLRGEPRTLEARMRIGAQHLHDLGARPTAEFLKELGAEHGITHRIADKLDTWRMRLTPAMVRGVGGHRWPPLFSLLRGGRP